MTAQRHSHFVTLKTVLMIATAVFIFILGTLATLSAVSTQAQDNAPQLISYQGYLTDNDGQPLDGTVNLTFAIYPAMTGGTALWSETQSNVPVSEGYFTVMLGSETPLSAATFSDPTRYLQIGVDSGGGMVALPRQQFTAVPYALQAANAWALNGNSGSDPLTHKLGTTDAVSLTLVVSDTAVLRFDPAYDDFYGHLAPNITANPFSNTIQADTVGSVIAGGIHNVITKSIRYGAISGGVYNHLAGNGATVGGGGGNAGNGIYATVGGGLDNRAAEPYATVGGGYNNKATGNYVTVAGGYANTANGNGATVGGGSYNDATGIAATVGGGVGNEATGHSATVAGGRSNDAAGNYSYAAGTYAQANHAGAFVWSDSSLTAFASTGVDQFLVEADGGMGVGTNAPATQLHVVAARNGPANMADHVVAIENNATTVNNGPDVLALKVTNVNNPGASTNYITFADADGVVGAIEGDGSGSVSFTTGAADFAEYLPLANPSEQIAPGTVVGLSQGQISHSTTGAEQVLVVSSAAGFVGNSTGDEEAAGMALVALMGQVEVQVRGAVQAGDTILASGLNDGFGVAVPLSALRAEQVGQVVGMALESSADGGLVLVLVGVPHDTIWQALLQSRDTQLADMEARLAQVEALLLAETTNAVCGGLGDSAGCP